MKKNNSVPKKRKTSSVSHRKKQDTDVLKKEEIVEEKKVKKKPVSHKKKIKVEKVENEVTVEKKKRGRPKKIKVEEKPTLPKIKLELKDGISPQEISQLVNKPVSEIITVLMRLGVIYSATQKITDQDTIILLFSELGYEVEIEVEETKLIETPFQETILPEIKFPEVSIKVEEKPKKVEVKELPKNIVKKVPVVTIMGHVDHGKTTLLDTIRKSKIVATEFGEITQHIGAYKVVLPDGNITFIDTPGHEAFSSLRARGSKVTDIVVLVVAGDEGVMPQTVEAINHAKVAGVPIIVAINKIDLPTCNPQKVKQQLSDYGLISSDWGGNTEFVEISARNNIGIDKLLDTILLQAESMELVAPIDELAEAVIIETELNPQRGPVATVIVIKGKLRVGETFVCGLSYGKVRAIIDDRGNKLDELSPGEPGEILGFTKLPVAGDVLKVVSSEKEARKIVEEIEEKLKIEATKQRRKLSFEDIISGKDKILNLVIKTDTQGSLEAIRKMLDMVIEETKSLPEMPEVRVVHTAVGEISESDILLASASNSVIIGFNIRPTVQAIKLAKNENVEIKTYRIIYELIDDIKNTIKRLEVKEKKEEFLGRARVKKVFNIPKVGNVAGCIVEEGKIVRNAKVRILRDNVIVVETKISSLKRFKEDVKEVEKGYECGIGLENFSDIKENDVIESYQIV